MSDSPLTEVTIPELFAIAPLDLSDADFDRIIQHYREERDQWLVVEEEKRKTPKRGTAEYERHKADAKALLKKQPKVKVTLADLGLGDLLK